MWLWEQERELENRRRDERFARDVKAEERRRSVEIERSDQEERPCGADGDESVRDGRTRSQHPDDQARREICCRIEDEGPKEQQPVPGREELRRNGDVSVRAGAANGVGHGG